MGAYINKLKTHVNLMNDVNADVNPGSSQAIGPRNHIQRAMLQVICNGEVQPGPNSGPSGAKNQNSEPVKGLGDPIDRYSRIYQKSKEIYKSSVRQRPPLFWKSVNS